MTPQSSIACRRVPIMEKFYIKSSVIDSQYLIDDSKVADKPRARCPWKMSKSRTKDIGLLFKNMAPLLI